MVVLADFLEDEFPRTCNRYVERVFTIVLPLDFVSGLWIYMIFCAEDYASVKSVELVCEKQQTRVCLTRRGRKLSCQINYYRRGNQSTVKEEVQYISNVEA